MLRCTVTCLVALVLIAVPASSWSQENAASISVTGTVIYRERMALPPDAVIEVQLLEVTGADAKAKVVAEETSRLGARQVPVPFEIRYDPGKIEASGTYRVSARILIHGQPQFVTAQPYLVLTGGNPSHLDLILQRVSAGP